MKQLIRQPLHPLLFAFYPVLALLAANISQVKPQAALRPLLVVLVGALGLWGLLRLLLHSWERAALVCTWLLVLFFTYGHVYGIFEGDSGLAGQLGHHRLLLPLWLGLAGLGSFWLARRVKDLPAWTSAVNWIGLVLVVMPLVQLGSYATRSSVAQSANQSLPAGFASLRLPSGEPPPDVYYLILDAYSRQDVLLNYMAYDNSTFLQALAKRGFYVATCSQSNYAQTELSLASSLNMAYLKDLGLALQPGSLDRTPLRPLLRHSAVRQALERLGYTFIAYETGFMFSQFEDADVYLSPRTSGLGGMSGFEVMLMRTTGGLALVDAYQVLPALLRPNINAPQIQVYQRTRFVLDSLEHLPANEPSPKFVFAHIVAPHKPQVFDAQGELALYPEKMDPAAYFQAYTAEVTYLNRRTLAIVDAILAHSDRPAVIILQADHGHDLAGPVQRMEILNAYYLPGGSQDLYPSISPVNTFRVVFNRYFGGSFEPLEDRSYFSIYQDPYTFELVPNECNLSSVHESEAAP